MASVEFGGGVSQLVGRLGGSVFQRGRTGAQLRTLPINTGRKQNQENVARSSLASVSTNWRTMSAGRQATWIALAAGLTWYNRFGVAYTPSGFEVFSQLNLNLLAAGQTPNYASAPAIPAYPSMVKPVALIDISAPYYHIMDTISGATIDWLWLVESTLPQGAGIYANRLAFRMVSRSTDSTSTSFNVWTEYSKRFGLTPLAGQVLFTRLSLIDSKTGFRTPSQVIRSIVT
jgi:hypothetical protein